MLDWIKRHRELMLWLPALCLLSVAGIVVLGGMAAGLGPDLLSWLAELPVYSAYGVAALGLSYVAWRRWSFRLKPEDIDELWRRLLAGQKGALVIHITNAAFYLIVLWLALDFFKPPR